MERLRKEKLIKRQTQSKSSTQPKCQKLKVEGYLRAFDQNKFCIFPLFQMHSQNTNSKQSYGTRLKTLFKTKLNIL